MHILHVHSLVKTRYFNFLPSDISKTLSRSMTFYQISSFIVAIYIWLPPARTRTVFLSVLIDSSNYHLVYYYVTVCFIKDECWVPLMWILSTFIHVKFPDFQGGSPPFTQGRGVFCSLKICYTLSSSRLIIKHKNVYNYYLVINTRAVIEVILTKYAQINQLWKSYNWYRTNFFSEIVRKSGKIQSIY